MSDQKKYAVNPSTGEVQEFDGSAWKPVDKARVAKDKAGGVAVFDGAAWTKLGAQPKQPEQRSVGDDLLRQVGLGGRYLLEGFSMPAEIVGNAANAAVNLGSAGINAIAGTNIPRLESFTEGRNRALSVLPSPENEKERVIGEMSKFIAGAGGMAGMAKAGELAGTKALAPMGENIAGQVIAAQTGGGAYGVAKERTDDPLIQAGAALGGGLMGGAGYAAAEKMLPSTLAKAKPPTTAEIKASSQAAYKASEDAGLIIKPTRMQQLSSNVKEKLAEFAFDPEDQPMIARVLARLEKSGDENITLKGVDVLRKKVVNILKDGNNTERMMAGKILSYIDDSMTSLTPDDVVQGNTAEAVSMLKQAQGLWRVQAKSQLIDDLVEQARRQAARSNSGGNLQNTLKQKFSSILDKPKLARMFTAEEKAAIEKIVRGNFGTDTLRIIGRLAPSSNSWLPILLGGGGYTVGGVPGGLAGTAAAIGVPAIGSMAKAGGTALTQRGVDSLSNMVRSAAIPRQAPQAPAFDPKQLLVQALTQGSRPLLPNAYAEFLLRSGGAAVPANGNPNTGSQLQP